MGACVKCHKQVDDTPFCPYCGAQQTPKKRGTKSRANGIGYAYKRGKTWSAQITVGYYEGEDGKLKRITKTKGGFKSKTAALEYCQVLKQQRENPKAPLLRDYWDTYERTEMEHLSDSKRTAYKIAWGKLKSLENRPVDQIAISDLRSIVSKKCPTYYTARDAKVILTHMYKLAGADGWVNKDLPSYIELPKLREVETQPFTDEEQELLWNSYYNGNVDAAMPLIMIATGMMPGELRRMTVDMIDLDARRITGAGLKTEVRKKLTVILPDEICPIIADIIEGRTGLLFPYPKNTFYDHFKVALKNAGITRNLTPYSCRHTTATRHTIDEHTPPQVVARIMRWSSTRMLDRYVHPSDEAAEDAVSAYGKHLKPGGTDAKNTG